MPSPREPDFLSHDAAAAATTHEPVYLCYGAFLQQCIDFAILAFCVFLMVKLMNRITRKKAAPRACTRAVERGASAYRDTRPAQTAERAVKKIADNR